MIADQRCPRCRRHIAVLLATTNEWRWYCPGCDVRFNDDDEILE